MRSRAERNADFEAVQNLIEGAIADVRAYVKATDEEQDLKQQIEEQERAIANLKARKAEFE